MKVGVKTNNMKYVITEDKFKNFLKKRFGVDLTGNIKIITSARDLSDSFGRFINPNNINKYLNMFGPMFLFNVDDNKYLYHDRGERTWITDINSTFYTEAQLLDELGLPNIGISINDLIDAFFDEEGNN